MFSLYQTVVSRVDLPDVGVKAGALGAIIDTYPDGACEVEFDPDADDNLITVALSPDQIEAAPLIRQAA